MGAIPTVRIKHPGGYAIINASDFDPAQHERSEAELPPSGGVPSADALPAGFEVKHRGGGKYRALVNGQALKDASPESGDADILFESRAEAEAALREYAAAQQAATGAGE